MKDRSFFLREIIKYLKHLALAKQSEVATIIGINETYLSDLLNARRDITDSFIENAHKNLGINKDFLIDGSGSMLAESIGSIEKKFMLLREKQRKSVSSDKYTDFYKDEYIESLETKIDKIAISLQESLTLLKTLQLQVEEHRTQTEGDKTLKTSR